MTSRKAVTLVVALVAYVLSIGFIVVFWRHFSPVLGCYAAHGKCFYQKDLAGSPYFIADLWFGASALLVGLAWAIGLRRWLRQQSSASQVLVALIFIGGGAIAARLGETPAVIHGDSGVDGLKLRALGLLFVWPLVVQVAPLVSGRPTAFASEFSGQSQTF